MAAAFVVTTSFPTMACAQNSGPSRTGIESRPTLVVAGFTRDIDVSAWRDARVGMGLIALLTDTLYASGLFRLVDEKPEVRQEVELIARRLWSGQADSARLESEAIRFNTFHPDIVASGRILRFEAPGSRASVGPLQRAQRTFTVELEVTLRDVARGKVYRRRGDASADRVAISAVFSVRGDNVLLDESGVGRATTGALRKAVGLLLVDYQAANPR